MDIANRLIQTPLYALGKFPDLDRVGKQLINRSQKMH